MIKNRCRSLCLIVGVMFLLPLNTPTVVAEDEVQALVIRGAEVKMLLDYRAGQEVPTSNLGEFLMKAFSLSIGGREGDPIEATLLIETISRESGRVGSHQSRPARLRLGTRTSGAALIPLIDQWIPQIDEWIPQREGRMLLGRTVTSRGGDGMPRECEDSSHAVRLTLSPVGERSVVDSPFNLCMAWRP